MPEMQKTITKLRFLLATIKGKEEELDVLIRQFQRQMGRAPNAAIHGGSALDATLGAMDEIQERLDAVTRSREHLEAVRDRAQDELRALELTDKVEQAKGELAVLKSGGGEGEKIQELERFIQQASLRAGQTITGDLETEAGE